MKIPVHTTLLPGNRNWRTGGSQRRLGLSLRRKSTDKTGGFGGGGGGDEGSSKDSMSGAYSSLMRLNSGLVDALGDHSGSSHADAISLMKVEGIVSLHGRCYEGNGGVVHCIGVYVDMRETRKRLKEHAICKEVRGNNAQLKTILPLSAITSSSGRPVPEY
jgi:hypothetical protein